MIVFLHALRRIKDGLFFILKVSVLLLIWKPILIIILILAVVGLIRLFCAGPFYHYDESLKDTSLLKKGDIILTGKQATTSSLLIQVSNVLTRKIKHRFWTHAAIYKGEGMLIEAQPKGIIQRDIKDYFDKGYLVRALRHKYIKDEPALDAVLAKCEEKRGRKYGFLGLLFFTLSSFFPSSLNFIFNNYIIDELCHFDDKYFCSELIVDSYAEAGYKLSPFDGWRVKPSDFIGNPLLEKVG